MLLRNYKYRLYPSKKHLGRLNTQLALCQELYNLLLQKCRERYKNEKKAMSKAELCRLIKEVKNSDPRFDQIYSQVLQNISDRLIKAYRNFFRRVKEKKSGKKIQVGFPRFKNFYRSATYPQFGFSMVSEKRLHLAKIGDIPIVLHRLPKGKVKTLTVKRNQTGKWFAVMSCVIDEDNNEEKKPRSAHTLSVQNREIGIDVGIESFATLSNGEKIQNPRLLIMSEKKLKRWQRKLSRKAKNSANRKKARVRLAKIHERITDQRADFLHKLSKKLSEDYDLMAVENLNVAGMMRWHLSKHISDASWNRFIQMLTYKASSAGGKVICVNPEGTTQECSGCGRIVKKTLAVRKHSCPDCGLSIDRDHNSAINILKRAKSTAGPAGTDACGNLASTPPFREGASQIEEAGTRRDK